MFPNRVPTDRDTLSPELLAKQGDSIYSFIHSCLPESSKRSPPTYIKEKHKVTVQWAPRRWKTYIQLGAAWFLRGIVNDTAISTPGPRSCWYDTLHLGLGTALIASMCHSNPHQDIPSTTVSASHVTQGRVEYESMIPRGTDEGLDLWKAATHYTTELNKQKGILSCPFTT